MRSIRMLRPVREEEIFQFIRKLMCFVNIQTFFFLLQPGITYLKIFANTEDNPIIFMIELRHGLRILKSLA